MKDALKLSVVVIALHVLVEVVVDTGGLVQSAWMVLRAAERFRLLGEAVEPTEHVGERHLQS